jgi:hypothetical protein
MNNDQIAAWKAALAARRSQQRRQRWRRPGPQATGIRVMPPGVSSCSRQQRRERP